MGRVLAGTPVTPQASSAAATGADDRIDKVLRLAEVFGATFQGEGPHAGRCAAFVRLGGCNLSCSWCDTRYSWDWNQFNRDEKTRVTDVQVVREQVVSFETDLVVVTGGEPLLQQDSLLVLVEGLTVDGRTVHVETNGTILPGPRLLDLLECVVVSAKLAGSGLAQRRRLQVDVLRHLAGSGKAVFKFVVTGTPDVQELIGLTHQVPLGTIWVMPEGTDARQVLAGARWLAPIALEHGWNLSLRLQVLLWGDERGR